MRTRGSRQASGRTTAPLWLFPGHEITGEVIERAGRRLRQVGDLCSVPLNIACGRCRNRKERHTSVCLNTNPERPGQQLLFPRQAGRGVQRSLMREWSGPTAAGTSRSGTSRTRRPA